MFPNTYYLYNTYVPNTYFQILNSPIVPSGQNVPSALLRVEAEKHVGHCGKHTGSSSLLRQSWSPKRFDKWKTFYNSFDIKAWSDLTSFSNTTCPELTRGYFGSSLITVSVNFLVPRLKHQFALSRGAAQTSLGRLYMIGYIYLFTHPRAKDPKDFRDVISDVHFFFINTPRLFLKR